MTLPVAQGIGQVSGFADAVGASQSVFRHVMNAMARPGLVETISGTVTAPAPMTPAVAALALTLCDHDTSVWLDSAFAADEGAANWLRFHTGAPVTDDSQKAAFAFIGRGRSLPPFNAFASGTPDYPDRSTTLVIQVDTLDEGTELVLSGPGIRGTSLLRAGALPDDFPERMRLNRVSFPLGVDLVLVCGAQIVALPRSTRVASRKASSCT
ncbi:MAG: phosphonate C-P lyase system protein PhnH [Bradyrhizobiaceae bacterium]|nr:MAG: phosphonate C-P lyase system protein PhnH [Bradyrhizobiaceae bacterium]